MEKFEKNKKISKNGQKIANFWVDNRLKIFYNKDAIVKKCFLGCNFKFQRSLYGL